MVKLLLLLALISLKAQETNLSVTQCTGQIFGCNTCTEDKTANDVFLKCTSCHEGLYLFQNKTYSSALPEYLTACVIDCKFAHHSFVNNPFNGKCEFCGNDCSSCNLKYGCETCPPDGQEVGMVNAYDSSRDFYSTSFKKCQECSNTQKCTSCSSTDPDTCTSCTADFPSCISYEPDQNLDNCLKASSSDSMVCEVCKDGYFVNSRGFCTSCKIDNCLTCTNSNQCDVCASGFSPYVNDDGKTVCYDCNYDSNLKATSLFPDCNSCSISGSSADSIVVTCETCRNGYLTQDSNGVDKCVVNCPAGKYGYIEYGSRGRPTKTVCYDCDSSCETCVGDDASSCTSCGADYYLSLASNQVSYGTCQERTGSDQTVTLFVTGDDVSTSIQDIQGTFSDPFPDLYDAISKAKELCAAVQNLCTVQIYMLSGTHYLLNKGWDFYRPLAQADASQIIKLTIQPLVCDSTYTTNCLSQSTDQLTIYNKRKERVDIQVSAGLTLKNLIIDSLDSIIPPAEDTNSCLSTKTQCCQIDESSGEIQEATSTNYGCKLYTEPTEDCQVTYGNSFIYFDRTDRSVQTSPPTLKFDNVVMKNILFEFNSIVYINEQGGHIKILDSQFSRISSCGALFKNSRGVYNPGFSNLDSLSNPALFRQRANYLQYETISRIKNRFSDPLAYTDCGTDISEEQCFSLTIRDSTFEWLGFQTQVQQEIVYVNDQLDMSQQARIINLDNFQGDIVITGSTFQRNLFYFESCELTENFKYGKPSTKGVSDQYPILGEQNSLQYKRLISVFNHNYHFTFANNIVQHNTAVGGLIFLETSEAQWKSNERQTLVYNNQFINNAAYYIANIMHIMRKHSRNIYSYIPATDPQSSDDDQALCGGLQISNNVFEKNFGCILLGGSLFTLECLKSDSYSFLAQSFDSQADTYQDQQFNQQDNYLVDFTGFTTSKMRDAAGLESGTLQVDLNKVQIMNNVYKENFASMSNGLITVLGFDRLNFKNETYITNGETTIEVILTYQAIDESKPPIIWYRPSLDFSTFIQQVSAGLLWKDMSLYSNSMIVSSSWIEGVAFNDLLLHGMIVITHARLIQMEDVYAESNYLYEMVTKQQRAAFLYVNFFYGDFVIRNVTFKNYLGVKNPFTLSKQWLIPNPSDPTETSASINCTYKSFSNNLDDNSLGQVLPMISCYEDYYTEPNVGCNFQSLELTQLTLDNIIQVISPTIKTVNFPAPAFFFHVSVFSKPAKKALFSFITIKDYDCVLCNGRTMFYIQTYHLSMDNIEVTNVNQRFLGLKIEKFNEVYSLQGQNNIFSVVLRKDSQYNQQQIVLKSITISKMFGKNGVFLNLDGKADEVVDFEFSIEDVKIADSYSLQDAALFKLYDLDRSDFAISRLQVDNTSGASKGVLIMATATLETISVCNSFTIQDSSFTNIVIELTEDALIEQQGWAVHIKQNFDFSFTSINNIVDCLPDSHIFPILNADWTLIETQLSSIRLLYSNDEDFGGVFYLDGEDKGSITVTSAQSTYKHCFNSYQGAVFNIQNINGQNKFIEQESTYENNVGAKAAAIYCYNCLELLFTSPVFKQNTAYQGSAMYLAYSEQQTGTITLNIDDFEIEECNSLEDGGFLFFNCEACTLNLQLSYTTISGTRSSQIQTSFINSQAPFGGGFAKITSDKAYLTIDQVEFYNAISLKQNGGAFLVIANESTIKIENSKFRDVRASLNGGIVYADIANALTVTNNKISQVCQTDVTEEVMNQQFNNLLMGVSLLGSIFYLNPGMPSTISTTDSAFASCFLSGRDELGGGVYHLNENVELTENKVSMIGIAAIQGGVYYCDSCNMTITDTTYDTIFCQEGCIIYATSNSTVSMKGAIVSNVMAILHGGLITVGMRLINENTSLVNTFVTFESMTVSGLLSYDRAPVAVMNSEGTTISMTEVNIYNFTLEKDNNPAKASNFIDMLYPRSTFVMDNCVVVLDRLPSDNSLGVTTPFNIYSLLYSYRSNNKVTIKKSKIFRTKVLTQDKAFSYLGTGDLTLSPKTEMLALLYVSDAALFEFTNNEVHDLFVYQYSSLYLINTEGITISSNKFYNLAALQGGVMSLQSCGIKGQAILDNNTYVSSFAQTCGAICHFDGTRLAISKSSFSNLFATLGGGAIAANRVTSASSGTPTLSISDSNFTDVGSIAKGGVFFINNFEIQMTVTNCNFKNVGTYLLQGGLFYSSDAMSVTFNRINVMLSDVPSTSQGRIFYNTGMISYGITITNSVFQCEASTNYFKASLLNQAEEMSGPSAFYLTGVSKIKMSSNKVSYCNNAKTGGVFYFTNVPLVADSNSLYLLNSAMQGGVYYLESSYLQATNVTMRENIASEGGAIIIDKSTLTASVLYIYLNMAKNKAGGLILQTQSNMNISDCIFQDNYAGDQNSAISILSASKFRSNIINTQFLINKASSNTIFVMYSKDLNIDGCRFYQNQASSITKNLFIGFSGVTISNTIFQDTLNTGLDTKELQSTEIKGSFLNVITKVNLTIINTQFLYGKANQGGAIYISGESSNIEMIGVKFQQNKAYSQGGAIYASSFQNFIISKNSFFKDNSALFGAGDIYAEFSNYVFSFQDSLIENSVDDQSIVMDSLVFYGRNLTIKRNYKSSSVAESGGSIYCQDCSQFHLNDSTITGSIAKQGGSIYLVETEIKKSQYSKTANSRYKMFNTRVRQSSATEGNGGAIVLDNIMGVDISRLNVTSNSAQLNGGGIYTACDSPTYNCRLTFYSLNTFNNNFANQSGGAIYWNDIEPKYTTLASQFSFSNNKATIYADNIGAYAQKLVQITADEYASQMKRAQKDSDNSRMLYSSNSSSSNSSSQTSASKNNSRSGDSLPTSYIALADKYGQIVGTQDLAKLQISVKSSGTSTTYAPVLDGDTSYYSTGGVFVVDKVAFTGTPGASYSLVFNTDGIDQSKPSNQEYKEQVLKNPTSDINFQFDISLRNCSVGEQFTDAGKCVECPDGESFSLVQMTSPGQCMSCPSSSAICKGGSNIGPLPGYWRKNNMTYVFVECFNTDACLYVLHIDHTFRGMVPPENNPQGSCEQGYSGILCTECVTGYSRTGNYKCAPCPEPVANAFKLIGIVIIAVVVIVFLIRSTLNGAADTKNVTSVYQKILLNHIQLLMVTSSFEFDWPEQVKKFFTTSNNVGQASEQIISVDCFLDSSSGSSILSPFYMKLMLFALLPFLLFIFSFSFWSIKSRRLKDPTIVKIKGMSTIVILLFLVHPNIVSYTFQTFKQVNPQSVNRYSCVSIDGDTRLKSDLEEFCYLGAHYFWALGVALPSIFVWGIGIPLFAFVLMTRERSTLEKIETKQKFGFLFRGYRLRFYYWEVIIMYRKISLIFISAFMVTYGVITQALVVFILLISFLVINVKKSPFQTVPLNQLETTSLVTSMLSVFCGLFFIVNVQQKDSSGTTSTSSTSYGVELSEDTQMIFVLVILLSNITFFTYWLIKFYDEIQNMLIKKYGKIYVLLCLCGDYEKFKKMEKESKIQEESLGFREKYLDSLKALKHIYNQGLLVLNSKNVEKVQMYLHQEKLFQVAGIEFDKRSPEQKEKEERRNQRKQRDKVLQIQAKQAQDSYQREKEQAKMSHDSEYRQSLTHVSRKRKLEELMDEDEVLADFKQKAVIEDYLDDQEKEFNDYTQYQQEGTNSQYALDPYHKSSPFTKENLKNLDTQNMLIDHSIYSQSRLDSERNISSEYTNYDKNKKSSTNLELLGKPSLQVVKSKQTSRLNKAFTPLSKKKADKFPFGFTKDHQSTYPDSIQNYAPLQQDTITNKQQRTKANQKVVIDDLNFLDEQEANEYIVMFKSYQRDNSKNSQELEKIEQIIQKRKQQKANESEYLDQLQIIPRTDKEKNPKASPQNINPQEVQENQKTKGQIFAQDPSKISKMRTLRPKSDKRKTDLNLLTNESKETQVITKIKGDKLKISFSFDDDSISETSQQYQRVSNFEQQDDLNQVNNSTKKLLADIEVADIISKSKKNQERSTDIILDSPLQSIEGSVFGEDEIKKTNKSIHNLSALDAYSSKNSKAHSRNSSNKMNTNSLKQTKRTTEEKKQQQNDIQVHRFSFFDKNEDIQF